MKFRFPYFIIAGLLLVSTYSCVDTALLPVVETVNFTAVAGTSATFWGNVPVDAGSAITARGVCWSTGPNPTTANSKATTTPGTGEYEVGITGLTMRTTYYARCYATNSTGTAYGKQLSFTTLLTDVDGNIYKTVAIGTQIWMAENLRTTKYRNGVAIANVTDPASWASLTTSAYSSYANNSANNATYGKLYNWYAVHDIRYIAPLGWHIPTQAEWTTLINYLGGQSAAGDKLKETGDAHWTGSYAGATNSSGFTALPGGFISSENNTYGFYNIGVMGQWWSSTEANSTNAWSCSLDNTSNQVASINGFKQAGLSIRCIKD